MYEKRLNKLGNLELDRFLFVKYTLTGFIVVLGRVYQNRFGLYGSCNVWKWENGLFIHQLMATVTGRT